VSGAPSYAVQGDTFRVQHLLDFLQRKLHAPNA
jgi:hypothetical protein